MHYIFVARPVTSVILGITPIVTVLLWWRSVRLRRKQNRVQSVQMGEEVMPAS